MKITQEITDALNKAIDHYGNVTQLAKHLGIAHSTILFWLSGKTNNISGQLWASKLRPALRPFLNGGSHYHDALAHHQTRGLRIEEPITAYGMPRKVESLQKRHDANIVNFAQIACFDPTLEPIDDYAKNCNSETVSFANEVKAGYFALEVEDNSRCSDFPKGTVLLVAGGEYAQRGDTVVAKLRDSGEVVLKIYSRKDNIIKLSSVAPGGKSIDWNCKDNPGFLVWMYPVIEVNINLRAKRWQETRVPVEEED